LLCLLFNNFNFLLLKTKKAPEGAFRNTFTRMLPVVVSPVQQL